MNDCIKSLPVSIYPTVSDMAIGRKRLPMDIEVLRSLTGNIYEQIPVYYKHDGDEALILTIEILQEKGYFYFKVLEVFVVQLSSDPYYNYVIPSKEELSL